MLNSAGSSGTWTVVCLLLWVTGCASGPQVVAEPYPVVLSIPGALTQAVDYEREWPAGPVPPLVAVEAWDRADEALATCNARLAEIGRLNGRQRDMLKPQGLRLVERLIADVITASAVQGGLEKHGPVSVTSYSHAGNPPAASP